MFPVLGVLSFVGDFLKGKSDERKQKAEIKAVTHSKRLDEIKQGNTSASDLDAISLRSVGWKDEFLLLVGFVPVVLSFIPSMVDNVEAGFLVLESMPEWYKVFIAAVVVHSLGFRRMILPAWESYTKAKWGKS